MHKIIAKQCFLYHLTLLFGTIEQDEDMAKVDTAMQAHEQGSNNLESNMLELTAQSSPASVEDQAVVLAILRELEIPRDLYPLVSVTFKMTAAKKNRMQRLSEKWELTYSELLRLSIERVVDVLESPFGEVLDILQAHRAAVIERRKAQAEREMQVKTRRENRHRSQRSVYRAETMTG